MEKMMLYFAKIGTHTFNLDAICHIKYIPSAYDPKYAVCFINGDEVKIDQQEYMQLMDDINTACSLVKLQKEKGEER